MVTPPERLITVAAFAAWRTPLDGWMRRSICSIGDTRSLRSPARLKRGLTTIHEWLRIAGVANPGAMLPV